MINLQFLGTGGLDSVRIRNKLSKDYRRFPTLLIDERLLIDPSEDIFEFEETFMLTGLTGGVKDVFITNSNLDHFSVCAIEKLADICRGVRVHATSVMKDEIASIKNAVFIEIKPFSLIRCDKYAILPLPAVHRTEIADERALNFLIEVDGKTIFYGLDGASIDPAAWQIMKEVKLDAAILECALADEQSSPDSFNHNNLAAVRTIIDIMLASGVAGQNTKFILSHIPTSKKYSVHDHLCEVVAESSIRIAYDGYFIGI